MRVGVLGAGQLGRMLAIAGIPMGIDFNFFDPNPESPVKQLGNFFAAEYSNQAAIDQFLEGVDIITFEFENLPLSTIEYFQKKITVHPSIISIQTAQDRLFEKHLAAKLGISTAHYVEVNDFDSLKAAWDELSGPAMLKTRRLGYDGKGQIIVFKADDLEKAWNQLGQMPCLLETIVPYEIEYSIIAVRDLQGMIGYYPLIENTHKDGILDFSNAPATNVDPFIEKLAKKAIARLMEQLSYVGVCTIEFFYANGDLLFNEMACRVHNSGHWTIEGAVTSQFENHLRAICGLPLGSCEARGFSGMQNLIGKHFEADEFLKIDGVHFHWYGKEPREGRKVGHVTVTASSESERDAKLQQISEIAQKH